MHPIFKHFRSFFGNFWQLQQSFSLHMNAWQRYVNTHQCQTCYIYDMQEYQYSAC